METTITTKIGAAKLLAENVVILAETGDWESAADLAEELKDLADIDSEKVIIEECPMAASGVLISAYPKK